MKLVRANERAEVAATEELPGKVNYFIGNDPARWRTGIPTYAKASYQDVYPGIDVVYYGNQGQLEYDFVVHPGSSPETVRLRFEGADSLTLDAHGDLVLQTASGEIRHRKPLIYQDQNGVRQAIEGGYRLIGPHEVRFALASYDTSRPLVIDPVLDYATYLGGNSHDFGYGIAVDTIGAAYVTGETYSADFPTTTGAFDTTFNGGNDAFVTKLNPAGSALEYSTYLGGGSRDVGSGIAVDAGGAAYVTGHTESADFPTTSGAFDTTFNGGNDAFVTKLDPAGSALDYSTYLGDNSGDVGSGIAVDTSGAAYVTGQTESADFPTTLAAFDPTFNSSVDAFVTKLNPAGSALGYSTYLGGSSRDVGSGIAVDTSGAAYVTGYTYSSDDFPTTPGALDTTFNGVDAFVTKLSLAGSALDYSTYLGGSSFDLGLGIAVDASGAAYVTGYTGSVDFPTTAGALGTMSNSSIDAFVTKLSPAGSALSYSTYLGGSSDDGGSGIAVDTGGAAYVTGYTYSADFPTTPGAFDSTSNGSADAFVTKLNPAGSALEYSTYLGGRRYDSGYGIAVDTSGAAYVTGQADSADFPTTPGAFDTAFNGGSDAFVLKVGFIGPPATLTLNPPAATNPVDSVHCVTATVEDAAGNAVPSVTVRFTVIGAVNTNGSATTDLNGTATFCYTGPPLPGADAITAYADTDDDNMQDAGEANGAASKTWVLPVTTPLCDITITNGGRITAANGDRATFGGNAKADESNVQGQEEYQDHGPVHPLNAHAISVLAIVCEGTTQASIYGQTIDGVGSFFYRISVKDLGEPGVGQDTYGILLGNGYTSGDQTLEGGNVQIRRE